MATLSNASCGGLTGGTGLEGGADAKADAVKDATNLDRVTDTVAVADAIDAAEDAGTAHDQWVEYCKVMTACGLSQWNTLGSSPDGGPPPPNLMTQCVADQLSSMTTRAINFIEFVGVPGEFVYLDCVLAGGSSCTSARACMLSDN